MTEAVAAVLYWLGLAGALAAIVVYFLQIALRPQWVRLLTGAGLFFTGLGLGQTALSLHALPTGGAQVGAGFGVLALLAAVYFQSAAALRGRRGERGASADASAGEQP